MAAVRVLARPGVSSEASSKLTLVLGRIHFLAGMEAMAACVFKINRRNCCSGVL